MWIEMRRYVLLFALMLFSVAVGAAVSINNQMFVLFFELALCVLVFAFAGARTTNLVLAFIVMDHLCQFLKRFMFVLGPQARVFYYIMQGLPDLFLIAAAALIFMWAVKSRPPASVKFWMAYFGAAVLSSLINIRAVPLQGLPSAGGILFPLAAFFIGMTLSKDFFGPVARLFTALISISVLFATYQLIIGPTPVDQAWAEATHTYSVEAAKVFDAMTSEVSDFRPYGYYADHSTWGVFLALALIVIIIAYTLGLYPKKWLYFVIPLTLVGLVECETRVAWLAFLGTLITYRIITVRLLRRPLLVIVGILCSFAVVVTLGDYAVHHLFLGRFSSGLMNRYATVGTLDARTSAWRLFVRNLPAHWLRGTGFGFGSSDPNVSLSDEVYSHSMYVEILVVSGLPGLILFLGFFYKWIKEAFWVARVSDAQMSRVVLWTIALVVGMLLTGSIMSTLFMTVYLSLLVGFVSGEWMRLNSRFAALAAIPRDNYRARVWQAKPVLQN